MHGFKIGEVFTESLSFLLKQLKAVFILAVVPYGLLVGLTFLATYAMPVDMSSLEFRPGVQYELDGLVVVDPATGGRLDLEPLLYYQLLMFLLALVVPVPFKVAWLRYALLGPRYQALRPTVRFGARELRFLGYTVLATLIMLAIAMGGGLLAALGAAATGSGIGIVIMLATMVALALVMARLYFVFPRLVMDLPASFGGAWSESRGQGFKLVVLTLMVVLVIGLPALVVGALLGAVPVLGVVVTTLLQILIDAGLWTALGFAFWKTTGIPGNQGPATEAQIAAFD